MQSASVCGLKHQNGGPFRSQTEHQMRQQPLPVLRVHPDGEAAEDRDNLSEAVLKYHRRISKCALLRDHNNLAGCRILTAGKYLPVSGMDRRQRLRRTQSHSYLRRRYPRDRRNMRPVPMQSE